MTHTIRDAGAFDTTLGAEGGGVLVAAYEPAAATAALTFATRRPGAPPSHVEVVAGVHRPFWWPLVLSSPVPAAQVAERSLEAATAAELRDAVDELGLHARVHVLPFPGRIEALVQRLLVARDFALVAVGATGRDRRAQRLCRRAAAWCPAELVRAPRR